MTLQRRHSLSGRDAAVATEVGLLAIPTLGCGVVALATDIMALVDSGTHGNMHPVDLTLIGIGGLSASWVVKRTGQAAGSSAVSAIGTLGTLASVVPGAVAANEILFGKVPVASHHEAVALIATTLAVGLGSRISSASKLSRGL